jgi:Uncharacterized conserved protein
MKESIHIKNFGPIKDILIEDIKPLTVFIGESAGGKSTIMKVLALFRWIFKMCNIREYLIKSGGKNIKKFELNNEHLRYPGLLELVSNSTHVEYAVTQSNGSVYTLKLKGKSLEIEGDLSEQAFTYEKLIYLTETRGFIPNLLGSSAKRPHFENLFEETLEHFETACLGLISDHENSLDDEITECDDIELLHSVAIDFLRINFSIKKSQIGGIDHFIQPCNDAALGDSVNSIKEEYTIPYSLGSSGIQNTVPILMILDHYSHRFDIQSALDDSIVKALKEFGKVSDFKPVSDLTAFTKCVHVHIEEPELGLFPDAQCGLFNSLINKAFVNNANCVSIAMTTHSPYILNHLNLLIKAHETNDAQFTNGAKISFDDVAAYQVEAGGIECLKCEEQGRKFIDTNALSNTINDTYNRYAELGK